MLKDISISKKLYFIVGTMAVLIVVELVTLTFAIHTLSSVRAFVGAEGLWSKSQKDAAYYLRKYAQTHAEEDYKEFQRFMAVPLGDHKTRIELLKPNPDMNIARQGFIEGRVHPDDIEGMINLFRRFHNISYIHRAIDIWTEADSIIAEFIPIGEKLHSEINSTKPSLKEIETITNQIDPINHRLTAIEDDFSYTLGEGSRWLENLILTILFSVVLTVESTGLILSITVSRGISKGLNEIIRASDEIKLGNLKERAKIFSMDEIGSVAQSINEMTKQLVESNLKISEGKEDLEELAMRLTKQNQQLIDFAHITSHNLRAPASNLFSLLYLYKQSKSVEEKESFFERIETVVTHLSETLNDLMNAIQIKEEGVKNIEELDFEATLKKIKEILSGQIIETGFVITYDFSKAPKIHYNKQYLESIILNLVSNAIKYRSPDRKPEVHIHTEIEKGNVILNVRDNGLGIDLHRHGSKLFGLRKTFHRNKEARGVGLFITKTQVEAMGGSIGVISQVNQGSIFYINFNSRE
ncbi:MAG: HAMP domain-containing histidine kinase [Bacteroidetes bacterium]|nr:HAMP domain-containing histidine kinase [Bacteroidota bacterium]